MARSRKEILIQTAVLTAIVAAVVFPFSASSDSSVVSTGSRYSLKVSSAAVSEFPVRNLLGIHAFWWGHREGFASSDATGTRKEVVDLLAAVGGPIRYGGGANEISWRACIGPIDDRPAVKAAAWAGPMQCRFGIDQYLALMPAAGIGSAWLIANIAGIDYVSMPTEEMAVEAAAAARYVAGSAPEAIRYWELGNELERGRYGWSPEQVAERASAAGKAILSADRQARLVVPLIEFNHPKQPRRNAFNRRVLDGVTVPVSAFALHLYYDGRPGGPSVPTQLTTVRETAGLIRRSAHANASIWITEHGRWPEGDSGDPKWRSRWTQTNDMNGVIGTADFLIGLAQTGAVEGAHLHGLRAGPWNIVDLVDGKIMPTGIGELMALLGRSGAQRRLVSVTTSRNESRYAGGYDLRAAAFTSDDGHLVVWAVNRASSPISMNIEAELQIAPDGSHTGRSLVCARAPSECRTGDFRILPVNTVHFDGSRAGQVSLPAYSVSVFHLVLAK